MPALHYKALMACYWCLFWHLFRLYTEDVDDDGWIREVLYLLFGETAEKIKTCCMGWVCRV